MNADNVPSDPEVWGDVPVAPALGVHVGGFIEAAVRERYEHFTSTSADEWCDPMTRLDAARGSAFDVPELLAEVKHWKDHAEDAGRGFARVSREFARVAAENTALGESLAVADREQATLRDEAEAAYADFREMSNHAASLSHRLQKAEGTIARVEAEITAIYEEAAASLEAKPMLARFTASRIRAALRGPAPTEDGA